MSLSSRSSVFTVVAAPEPGARRRDESVWRWLERSSEPVAAAARAQWDSWLSRMPPGPRAALIRRLQDRHDEQVRAALAELVTFVLLDSVYPAIEVDPETGSGSRTDLAVDARCAGGLPGRVENTAYFVVAEALTNIAKHSGATNAAVTARRHGNLLVVEISDNGCGDADPACGTGLTGLTGLADRVAVAGGRMLLSSPPGGPTLLRAELPCS